MKRTYSQEQKAKRAVQNKAWRAAHPDSTNPSRQAWRAKNRDRIRARSSAWLRKWRSENLDEARRIGRECQARRRSTPHGIIEQRLRVRLNDLVRFRIRNCIKHSSALDLIGCTRDELVKWIEGQFVEGMTWEDRGAWHIDHKTPCSAFDLTKLDEQKRCFHFTNLQPLWAHDNQRKATKILSAAS